MMDGVLASFPTLRKCWLYNRSRSSGAAVNRETSHSTRSASFVLTSNDSPVFFSAPWPL